MNNERRASGILLPIFSLPSRYGIGTFGREAYAFVDALKEARQKYWQVLPLGPTSYGDSPYSSFSTFAGNPYMIDLEQLMEEKLLTRTECNAADFGEDPGHIDYGKLYTARFPLLKKAYRRSKHRETAEFLRFMAENEDWLGDYCLFMALKTRFNGAAWQNWVRAIKSRKPEAVEKYQQELADEIDFHRFLQFYFTKQWTALKAYANQNGIQIIGDLPIYVAMDSADAWANPHLFRFSASLKPTEVAGVPPDYFSADGQLWGNPLYNWPVHKKTGYSWWLRRISYAMGLYDTLRIDHFRGFAEYWAVPFGSATARNGRWRKGPGMDLFRTLERSLGQKDIIAEDLGVQSEGSARLLEQSGFPGMCVLQFAFNQFEDSNYLPHNYRKNCVVYTGTHDNTTTLGWYDTLSHNDRLFVDQYCRSSAARPADGIIATAFQSVARLVIIPIQDYLNLDAGARINTPSTLGNWTWRLQKGQFGKAVQQRIAGLTRTYFRG